MDDELKKKIEAVFRKGKDMSVRRCPSCGGVPRVDIRTGGSPMTWRIECPHEDCPRQPYTSSVISLSQARDYWNDGRELYNKKR